MDTVLAWVTVVALLGIWSELRALVRLTNDLLRKQDAHAERLMDLQDEIARIPPGIDGLYDAVKPTRR